MIAIAFLLATTVAGADPSLTEYARLAPGRYTSAAQAAHDERYDVVEAEVTRIWPERTDGVWLYQEQSIVGRDGMAAAEARAQPYFQRVGHIYRGADGRLRRDNYVLKTPATFVGRGTALTPADLGPAGCHNILERVAAAFWIARTEACANAYKGAAEMRSVSVQTADTYANWDRGFAADGRQVWGPSDGGYVFVKASR